MNQRSAVAEVILYRIGRSPDPLSAPPPEVPKNSGNRFDDPRGEFWVMYAAERRCACFIETLARFRPDLTLLARIQSLLPADDDTSEIALIPDDWHSNA